MPVFEFRTLAFPTSSATQNLQQFCSLLLTSVAGHSCSFAFQNLQLIRLELPMPPIMTMQAEIRCAILGAISQRVTPVAHQLSTMIDAIEEHVFVKRAGGQLFLANTAFMLLRTCSEFCCLAHCTTFLASQCRAELAPPIVQVSPVETYMSKCMPTV